jgi:hypothetical protein
MTSGLPAKYLPERIGAFGQWVVLGTYALLQPLIYILMMRYGRDTGSYLDEIGGGTAYLEPSWTAFFSLLDLLGFPSAEAKLTGIFIVLALAGWVLLRVGLSFCRHSVGMVGIFALVCSVEISAVGGSLRQGVASLLISVFLFRRKEYAFVGALFSHWSSVAYIALRPLLLGLVTVVVIFYGASFMNMDFLGALTARLLSYVKDESRPISLAMAVSLTINKLIILSVFAFNMDKLKLLEGGAGLRFFFIAAPIVQILLLNFSGSELIFHRVGMIMDPFLNVFTMVIIGRGGLASCSILMLIVASKFLSRFILLLS